MESSNEYYSRQNKTQTAQKSISIKSSYYYIHWQTKIELTFINSQNLNSPLKNKAVKYNITNLKPWVWSFRLDIKTIRPMFLGHLLHGIGQRSWKGQGKKEGVDTLQI